MSDRHSYHLVLNEATYEEAMDVLTRLCQEGFQAEYLIDAIPHPVHVVPMAVSAA